MFGGYFPPGSIACSLVPLCKATSKNIHYLVMPYNNNAWLFSVLQSCSIACCLVQGGPERSRQSNLAVFAVEG